MTKKQLTNIFMEAKRNKNDICVAVTIPGQDGVEYIINRNKNIENKLQYYLDTYDANLVHCRNGEICIVDAFEITDFYMGEEN